MTNNWRTYECSTKFCSYVTTGRVFQILLRRKGYSSQWKEWEKSFREVFFSLVTNSSLKLKFNIFIMKLSILLSKDILFLYYIQVIRFRVFWEKSIFFIYFIDLFYPGYVLDFTMYHIWYTICFSPKNREGYFHKPI